MSTQRQALYFPADMLEELQRESKRQDRSISWLMHQAWKIARTDLQKIPSTHDVTTRLAAYDANVKAKAS